MELNFLTSFFDFQRNYFDEFCSSLDNTIYLIQDLSLFLTKKFSLAPRSRGKRNHAIANSN